MLKRLDALEAALLFLLLAAITGLVFVAALMRFFGHPLTWSVDMAQLLFIWLCFLGGSRAMRAKAHLGMEVLAKRLSDRNRFTVEMACSGLVIAFLLVLAVEGVKLTLLNLERQFGDSTLSYAWVTVAVPVGCVLIACSLAFNMLDAWRRRATGVLPYTRTAADREAPSALEL
ncbi:TRAP transporter small permease [Chthonobacter rhizosphaerae]|uniref:TRAP transporter small permease n=1 Tax=Chthonobacter rhizosphaerae TaxID=2735553 RepID=UPI0015EF6269|nr:TRAP transporter small permease subunit [Chthonobacter rhizosphaerae]